MVHQFLEKAEKHADERIKLSKAIDNKIWEAIGIGRKASVLLAKVIIPMLSGDSLCMMTPADTTHPHYALTRERGALLVR